MREVRHTPAGNAAGGKAECERETAQTVWGYGQKRNTENAAERTEKRPERPEGKENSHGNTRGAVQQDHR